MALLHLQAGINHKSYREELEQIAEALLGMKLKTVVHSDVATLLSRLSATKGEIALLLREAFEESERNRLGFRPKVGPN